MALAGAAAGRDGIAWAGVGSFIVASPISHWARGNVGMGWAALGLNAGLPLATLLSTGMFQLATGRCSSDQCATGSLAVGMAVALAIDVAVLSWKRVGSGRRQFLSGRSTDQAATVAR